ncbi:MAG: oxidoreductase [Rhodospirillaceae bacterium]|nr:MAG: oxidoreductase [Rhodospirillaceae bacterium]
MSNSKILEGRTALITGASRGIGRAVALHFAEQGAHVIITARSQGALEDLDDELQRLGHSATLVPCDLCEPGITDKIADEILNRYKKLDILVGNAGILGELDSIAEIDPEDWQRVIDINLTANWHLIRSMNSLLKASDAGRAIFVSSSVGHQARAGWSTYAVSKAALEMTAGIYAEECKDSNILVNMINPGGTRTQMRAAAMPKENPTDVKTPDSINHLFLELASPAYTKTGQMIEAEQELATGHTTYAL